MLGLKQHELPDLNEENMLDTSKIALTQSPTSIDWRPRMVDSVKDQGTSCKSSWAFTAASTLASASAIAGGGLGIHYEVST